MFEDKSLTCKDCGNEFVFSAGEQEFYSKQGFNEPVRCKACRDAKKARNNTRSNQFFYVYQKVAIILMVIFFFFVYAKYSLKNWIYEINVK